MPDQTDLNDYLKPGIYIDSDSSTVIEFTRKYAKGDSLREKAASLFLAVRDGFRYDPYGIIFEPDEFKASVRTKRDSGFCIHKAIILTAALRAAGIPARLFFADVKNHLSSKRLREMMKTDTFYYHCLTEMFLDGKWLRVTPTFNIELCDKFGIKPLGFDGKSDCIFHPYDKEGNRHMEYVNYHGSYADFPYELIVSEYLRLYPNFFDSSMVRGNFTQEAEVEN